MTDEDWKGGLATHRKRRDRLFKTLKGQQQELLGLQRSEEFHTLTHNNIKDRMIDYAKLHARIEKHMEGLEDEEDDEVAEQDDSFQRELKIMYDEATRILSYLGAIKKVTSLLGTLEARIIDLERLRATEPDKDYSACFSSLDKLIEKIQSEGEEGDIEVDHALSQQARLLSTRILGMKTTSKPESKPTTVDTTASRHIDAPKVNLPDFHGDLLSWPPFWSRYNASVHESTKLTNTMKMAVLMDRIKDPGISKFLIAANDGKPGRYDEVILYLKDRFNRPRELHQVYLQQLIDLPPIEGTSAEISKAVDTVYSAVTGIRGSGQVTIETIATSLVVAILPERLRQEWENKTEEIDGVPDIDKWITFMRKKATKVSHTQKGVATTPAESISQPRYPRERKKKPKEARVYTSHGESASGE